MYSEIVTKAITLDVTVRTPPGAVSALERPSAARRSTKEEILAIGGLCERSGKGVRGVKRGSTREMKQLQNKRGNKRKGLRSGAGSSHCFILQ